jgi:hypothetical protein
MTLGSHQRNIGASQVHITPKWITGSLMVLTVVQAKKDRAGLFGRPK